MKLSRPWQLWRSFLFLAKGAALFTAVAALLALMRGVDLSDPLVIATRLMGAYFVILGAFVLLQLGIWFVVHIWRARDK